MNLLLQVVFGLPALIWLYTLVAATIGARRLQHLDDIPAITGSLPSLTIVIAARNEAHTLAAAMQTLLATKYPALEIIAINDRSTDATGAILEQLANENDRLRVMHVSALPDGWLGKNHAMQLGLQAASSEYVLFTDADVHFHGDVLERAVSFMHSNALDHLASLPQLVNTHPSLRLMLPAFAVFFLQITQPWKASDPDSRRHIGVGAFNLVRRETLQRLGGFEAIRLRPDDDLRLARLLKQHGARADFVRGDGLLEVEWYHSAGEMIRGLEKNAFAQFNYRPWLTVAAMLFILYLVLAPLAGCFWLPSSAGILSLTGTLAMLLFAVLAAHASHVGAGWGLAFPLGTLLLVWTTLRSMLITLRDGGIRWRDTFYPLTDLRRNP